MEIAFFGAGCFWGVQYDFDKINGVISTRVGYMGGNFKNPTYKDVCTDKTGHAEIVEIKYDPEIISYKELLDVFWKIHDPTQLNKQGPDIGSQYRSVIFYKDKKEKIIAEKTKLDLEKSGLFKKKITTEIISASNFYPAEEYHQKYYKKHGLSHCKII